MNETDGIKQALILADLRIMRFYRNPVMFQNPREGGDHRGCGRLRCELIHCDLGEIADMSATGMRVKARSKPPVKVGERIKLTLRSVDIQSEVWAEVVWLKKKGWFRHELGLRFMDVGMSTRALLDQAISVSMCRLTIADR